VTALGASRYISITTFRRDGRPVATPVWVVADAGRLYVWTGSQTGKVKRVRHNPDVSLAPCTARGSVTGPPVAAQAEIVPASERPDIWAKFQAKYGFQLRATQWAQSVQRRLRRTAAAPAPRVYLELTIASSAAPSA
jgi:uncharacterized protein